MRVFTDQEKQLLVTQVEKLKNQLQSTLEHIVSQNQKSAEISKKLQREVKENKTLWDQVEYLTTELNKERIFREKHHVCRREKADFQEALNVQNSLNKQVEETQKQLVEHERQKELQQQQKELQQQQGMENYFTLEMTSAQNSELRLTCENLEQVQEMMDRRPETAEEHRNTSLQQKLKEAESIISEQNVVLHQIKQEIKLLKQKHREETRNVSQLADRLQARGECKQHQDVPLEHTVKSLREEESRSLWHWNAPRTC